MLITRKKAEKLKKKQELRIAAEQKKKEELKLAAGQKKKKEKLKLVAKQKKRIKGSKTKNDKIETKDIKKDVKVVNSNAEEKGKASPVVSVGGINICNTNQEDSLRITFGGVVDSQGYGNHRLSGYNHYNVCQVNLQIILTIL